MKSILVIFSIFFSITMFSQNYNSAIGLRGGLLNAVTYKFNVNDWSAGEGIASFRYGGVNIIGLYTIQNDWDFEGVPLQWYYGGGGHVGFTGNRWNGTNFNGGAYIGVDAVIGIEHTLADFPVNISLDYKPALNLIGFQGWEFDSFSLGIRYVLD